MGGRRDPRAAAAAAQKDTKRSSAVEATRTRENTRVLARRIARNVLRNNQKQSSHSLGSVDERSRIILSLAAAQERERGGPDAEARRTACLYYVRRFRRGSCPGEWTRQTGGAPLGR